MKVYWLIGLLAVIIGVVGGVALASGWFPKLVARPLSFCDRLHSLCRQGDRRIAWDCYKYGLNVVLAEAKGPVEPLCTQYFVELEQRVGR